MVQNSEKQIISHIQDWIYFQVKWQFNDSLNPETNKTLTKLSNSVPLSIGVQASGTIYIKKSSNMGRQHRDKMAILTYSTWLLGLKSLRVSRVQTSITTKGMTTI
jgi:hypothetical protein